MQEILFITLDYRAQKTRLEGLIVTWDYMHLIVMNVNGIEMVFYPGKNQKYVLRKARPSIRLVNSELLRLLTDCLNARQQNPAL